jgi:hypothetical protein
MDAALLHQSCSAHKGTITISTESLYPFKKRPADKGKTLGDIVMNMATIHISEADAARDFAGLMARVRAGVDVVIDDASPGTFECKCNSESSPESRTACWRQKQCQPKTCVLGVPTSKVSAEGTHRDRPIALMVGISFH